MSGQITTTTTTGATLLTSPARRSRARQLSRRIAASTFAVLAATTLFSLTATSPAQAAVADNAPNYFVGGYGVSVSTDVFCDKASRKMTVTATTSSMQTVGPYGPVAGPYDAGQWVRYNILARDVNASGWTQIYTWSAWQFISGVTSTLNVDRLQTVSNLGTNIVSGSAGHKYQVLVQIDWWTGKDNTASFPSTYTQILSGRYMNPSSCSF